VCNTFGVTVAPYDSFCDRHREVGELHEKPNLRPVHAPPAPHGAVSTVEVTIVGAAR
jgi:hypothetical protein